MNHLLMMLSCNTNIFGWSNFVNIVMIFNLKIERLGHKAAVAVVGPQVAPPTVQMYIFILTDKQK